MRRVASEASRIPFLASMVWSRSFSGSVPTLPRKSHPRPEGRLLEGGDWICRSPVLNASSTRRTHWRTVRVIVN